MAAYSCDEQKPSCANCVKQGADCEYRAPTSREASHTSPLPDGTPTLTSSDADSARTGVGAGTISEQQLLSESGPAPVNDNLARTDLTLNIPQLRLLQGSKLTALRSHYTTVTAKTLAAHTDAEDVYKITLPELAFSHPYLLHAILSLSALHLSRLARADSEAQSYLSQAEQYRSAALHGFQTTVHGIDDSNFKAVLLFTGILFPHACATWIALTNDLSFAFSNIISNLILTRRMRFMVTDFYTKMQESELARVVPLDVKNIDWYSATRPATTELVQLRKFAQIMHHVYPPDIIDAYSSACNLLERIFDAAAASPTPPSDGLLKTWIHLVSERYIELLAEKQPGSLIIFAHFAVLMHRAAECYWYMQGVAEQILRVAEYLVPVEWRTWLEWPREQIGLGEKE
ncbi:hypothetical protein yc1106_07481 [Curvularia clavata]|uniref:Zn(2)-C6 fungal-type domain-containing protein n=1 Tax=Curvularia clavata TaxID=95742 RepID=A0A9Q8ZDU8_CURCL|nr:hypothetical protein yc1106_07481 [Curvularia clavata]